MSATPPKLFRKVLRFLAELLHTVLLSIGVFASITYLDENYPRSYHYGTIIIFIGFAIWFSRSFIVLPYLEGFKHARKERSSTPQSK